MQLEMIKTADSTFLSGSLFNISIRDGWKSYCTPPQNSDCFSIDKLINSKQLLYETTGFIEAQIVQTLKEYEAGKRVEAIGRDLGV